MRRNISSSALYEHELQLKRRRGVVEYAVRREDLKQRFETSGGGKDVFKCGVFAIARRDFGWK